ncbi:MAG: DUF1549 domain-containing protein [Lentisphaeraceae bacterium]|nr:DUF1549 domain-containing protein [Lentisphaeraceae bacterium]
MKKIVILIFLLALTAIGAEKQSTPDEQLIRRLYLDLFGRTPTVTEFYAAKAMVDGGIGYESFVDEMMGSEEFKKNLSWHIVRHYSEGVTQDKVISFERTRRFIEDKYLNWKGDIRDLLKDIVLARGPEAWNPLVRFYAGDDTPEKVVTRFTERMVGIPMGCAQCHDHKFYPELLQKEFWGLTGFFQATIVRDVDTENKAKAVFNESRQGGKKLGDEQLFLNTWLYNEENGIDTYKKNKKALTRTLIDDYDPYADEEEDENMMMDSSKPLLSPQMVILEEKKTSSQLKVYYTHDEKPVKTNAMLPLKVPFSRGKGFPRENAVIWLYSPRVAPHLSRTTANWVLNWLMGQGIKEMVTDTYHSSEYEQQDAFDKYGGYMRKTGYNLFKFVKFILMTPEYRNRNSNESTEGIYKTRNLRYLAGRHLANIISMEKDQQILKMPESSEKFTNEAEIELKKFSFIKTYFSNSLAPGLYEDGSTKQALFTATNEIWLKHAEKLARKGHAMKGNSKKWINDVYVELYTREATEKEKEYLSGILDNKKPFAGSNYLEVVWALINGPEMRLY